MECLYVRLDLGRFNLIIDIMRKPVSLILSSSISVVSILLMLLFIVFFIFPAIKDIVIVIIEVLGVLLFILILAYFIQAMFIEKRL